MSIYRIIVDKDGPHKLGFRGHDSDHAERWAREAAAQGVASGHVSMPIAVHFEPAQGGNHGRDIIQSVHRLVADLVTLPNGTIELRALHHYPEREPDDTSGPAPQHPLISKRQWAKIPQVASKRHWIVPHEGSNKTP